MSHKYRINEIFYSIQGEGAMAGTPAIFVRFSGCNMNCSMKKGRFSPGGFECDTEFKTYTEMTLEDIYNAIVELDINYCPWLIATGGEPGLQLDDEFIDWWHSFGGKIAIETNGTIKVSDKIDWITVSPKVPENEILQIIANEVKYVRAYGQPIPQTVVLANHYIISPAWDGYIIDPNVIKWCADLVKENPNWRLCTQMHKLWLIQ